jgi:hypothetical protein
MVGETRSLAGHDGGRKCAFNRRRCGDIAKGRFGRLRAGPDVTRLGLERSNIRIAAESTPDVLGICHWDVGICPGYTEGVVHELTEAGATGEPDQQDERSQTPDQGSAPMCGLVGQRTVPVSREFLNRSLPPG